MVSKLTRFLRSRKKDFSTYSSRLEFAKRCWGVLQYEATERGRRVENKVIETLEKLFEIERVKGLSDADLAYIILEAVSKVKEIVEHNNSMKHIESLKGVESPNSIALRELCLKKMGGFFYMTYMRKPFIMDKGVENHLKKRVFVLQNASGFIKDRIETQFVKEHVENALVC